MSEPAKRALGLPLPEAPGTSSAPPTCAGAVPVRPCRTSEGAACVPSLPAPSEPPSPANAAESCLVALSPFESWLLLVSLIAAVLCVAHLVGRDA